MPSALIAELGLPNLKLQYDIYHRQILHGDVMKSLEALMPITGHVQTASVPKRNEPGTGELDDWRIFHHLDALGYDGLRGLRIPACRQDARWPRLDEAGLIALQAMRLWTAAVATSSSSSDMVASPDIEKGLSTAFS